MKKVIYSLIIASVLIVGGLSAKTLIATDHSHAGNQKTSHSGGTDAYGCHTNHKTGVYHCH